MEITSKIREIMPRCDEEHPDWRPIKEFMRDIQQMSNMETAILKSEYAQRNFDPLVFFKGLEEKEKEFLRFTTENVAQHIINGTALIIRRNKKEQSMISVCDNGKGFINKLNYSGRNNKPVSISEALVWGKGFGLKEGYNYSYNGKGFNFAVGYYADISVVETLYEIVIVMPGKVIYQNVYPKILMTVRKNNLDRDGTQITGYFYKGDEKNKELWTKKIITEVEEEIFRRGVKNNFKPKELLTDSVKSFSFEKGLVSKREYRPGIRFLEWSI